MNTVAGAGLRHLVQRAGLYAFALITSVVVAVPLLFAVLGGFSDTGQLSARAFGLPDPWVFSNYLGILASDVFWRELANSVVIAVATSTLVVIVSAMAAFVFARVTFRGREAIFTLFTLGLLFPVTIAILPLYIIVRQLGLLGNPLGVILPQVAFNIAITIVILRPFFRNIPSELEDAASIDGCGRIGFFWRVLLPLSRPALATVAVLALVSSWNAFLLPLVVLTDSHAWTLPLGVTNFSTQYSVDTAKVLAFTTLSMIPALGFYLLAERQLIGGLTSGAVKG